MLTEMNELKAFHDDVWILLEHHQFTRHAVAINDSGYIFVGWGNESGGAVERSTDNGASWINTGLVANSYALAINASGTIFSGGWYSAGACVFRSTDNGSSWINTGFPTMYYPVNAIVISAAGHIFAGTFSEGVYRSTDDGANWTTVNSGLTNDTVGSIAINHSGTIFAAIQNGLFRSVQSTTSVRELSADPPNNISLAQNYPNPFNPNTTIKLRSACAVRGDLEDL